MARRDLDYRVTPLTTWIEQARTTSGRSLGPNRLIETFGTKSRGAQPQLTPSGVPALPTRRDFLQRSGVVSAGLLVAPTALTSVGCPELVTIFKAIEAGLDFFGLKDDVYGITVFRNGGGKDVKVETLIDLVLGSRGKGLTVDEGRIDPLIPADGEEHVVEYTGLVPGEPGNHFVEGRSPKKTRRTLDFTVTPA